MDAEIHQKLSPGEVTGILVSEGQKVRVATLSGGQVVDTWAFGAPDFEEYLSMAHTRTALYSTRFQKGDALVNRGLVIDHIVHATGSTGTQAGLVTGLKALNANIPVMGISVRAAKEAQEENVFKLASATADVLGCPGVVSAQDIAANSDYVGEGYGLPTEAGIDAIRMFAKFEGLLLDPVYSSKGAAGLIDLIRKGHYKKGERVVFLHTGGSVSLFGYLNALSA